MHNFEIPRHKPSTIAYTILTEYYSGNSTQNHIVGMIVIDMPQKSILTGNNEF